MPDSGQKLEFGIEVWDLPVRLYHWLQFVGIAIASITGFLLGAVWINIHAAAGIAVLVLVMTRVLWGFIGSHYARFSSFVPGPTKILHHATAIIRGKAETHAGHNPLGALMILALLAVTTGLSLTGLAAFGGIFKDGPAAGLMTYAYGISARNIHETLSIALLALVALHIVGALFESWRSHENLTLAMITGRKKNAVGAREEYRLPNPPARALAAFFAVLLLSGTAAYAMAKLSVKGAPVAPLDPTFMEECTACHMAYHPSLMPAESWRLLMANLDNHFGEDASLGAAKATAITDWLTGHAAQTADSKPANVLRIVNEQAPYTLTETPYWARRHRAIPAAVFSAPPVNSSANCIACHRDVKTGWFYPGNIEIPKEALK